MIENNGENFIQYAPHGNGGEQGLEFLSRTRFSDVDGEDADGFFLADGPNIVALPVTNKMQPCMRKFTYDEERSPTRKRFENSSLTTTSLPRLLSGEFGLLSRAICATFVLLTFEVSVY